MPGETQPADVELQRLGKATEQMRFRQIGRSSMYMPQHFTLRADNFSQNLEKVIPGTPKGEIPVHLREKQVFQSLWARGEMPNPNKTSATKEDAPA